MKQRQNKITEGKQNDFFKRNLPYPALRNSCRAKSLRIIGVISLLTLIILSGGLMIFSSSYVVGPSVTQKSGTGGSSNFQTSSLYPLPKSVPPSSILYVAQVGRSKSPLAYTIPALQGIVARTQPQIFVTSSQDDQFWLNNLVQNYGITTKSLTQAQVLQQFQSYVTDSNGNVKVILFDSNDSLFPMQVNIARSLAGVYTALPVSSSDLSTIESIYGSKIDVLFNLHGMFSDKVSGYTWLWNNVESSVTKSFFAMSPAGMAGLTDYLVEFKSYIFEFTSSKVALTSAETSLANTVTGAYPPNTPVLGFFGLGGEVPTINFLSPKQDLMIPGDGVSDLSLFSGLPDATNLKQVASAPVTYDKTKTYVVFGFSQGTALTYDFNANRHTWEAIDPVTNAPYRNEVPAAFQINPVLAMLAPPVIEYWYQTMTPKQSFMTGGSGGAGYVHPEQLPDEPTFVAMSDKLDSNIGINDVFLILDKVSTTAYQNWISDSTTKPAAIYDWQQKHASLIVSGTPVLLASFWAPSKSSFTSTDVLNCVLQIQKLSASGGHFVYVNMDATNPGFGFIQQVYQQLGSNYVGLNGEQFANVYAQANGI